MGHAIETIAEGHPLQSSLEALYARRGLRPTAVCTLRGALTAATLRPAPDAPPAPLGGPLYLVHGTVVPAGRRVQIMATVSWSDNGLPRLVGGLLDDAISAGIQVIVPLAEPAVDAPADAAAPVASATEAPARPRGRRKKKPAAEQSPHVDLSAEMAALGGTAPADDAEAPPWEPTPPSTPAKAKAKPKPASQGGGWGAAVAASRAAPSASRRPASPSDLGFDVDGPPDLRKGDTIIHPRFGRCRVVKPSRDRVKVRRPTGAFIDLHLKVCHFTRLPDEDGRRIFDLRIGR